MTVSTLINKVKVTLQDEEENYWTSSELLDYYNGARRMLAAERQEEPTTTTQALTTDTYEYSVSGVLRYISVVDSNGLDRPIYTDDTTGDNVLDAVIVLDYDRIYVNNPETGATLSIKHISLPSAQDVNSTVRDGDEGMLRNYMIKKAYEKESDMENFAKVQYFDQEYKRELALALKSSRMNYIDKVQVTDGYYY